MMAELKARLYGLGLIGLGIAFGWFFGLKPLWDAQAHRVTEISVDMRLFFIAPMAIIGGVFALVGGARVVEAYSGPPRNAVDHALLWPMMILTGVASWFAWSWMDAQLDAIGFVTR